MLDLPVSYFIAVGLAGMLLAYACFNLNTNWAIPYLATIFTIAGWYFVEPSYFPDEFKLLGEQNIEVAYYAVILTLLAFGATAPGIVKFTQPKRGDVVLTNVGLPAERILVIVFWLWLFLLAYGTYRMEGDLFAALFPLGGRSGTNMWSRGAGATAGNDGFIVSTAGYIYLLCISTFGVLYALITTPLYSRFALILIAISWPYVVFQGSRNLLLAAVLPAMGSYMLFSSRGILKKAVVFCGQLVVLEFVLRVIISFRNEGFEHVDLSNVEETKHLGLNMASELVYCVMFISDGRLDISFGLRYIGELLNVVPRVIWPDKPLLGIDYALARGFGGGDTDIGVVATISSGAIGGGVLNFGIIFGPICVGVLMSFWVGLLSRFRAQGTPLRLTLFLVGLGLTFNLGRDITLLVLWPLVFGYVLVRLVERWTTTARPRLRALQFRDRS